MRRLYLASLSYEAVNLEAALNWSDSIKKQDAEEYFKGLSLQAQIFQELGKDGEALVAFEKMREVRPLDCRAHLAAADLYLEREELASARAAHERSTTLKKCKADGLAGLAEVCYARGDLAKAVKHYQAALKARPEEVFFQKALQQVQSELDFRNEKYRLGK